MQSAKLSLIAGLFDLADLLTIQLSRTLRAANGFTITSQRTRLGDTGFTNPC